jgi:hypothetical protein
METKTHWKKLQHPDYIGAYELMDGGDNKELNVKIGKVSREMITGADGKKEECTIMTIPPHKPMILNVTNQKTLTKAIGSPFIEDWSGKTVTLYVAKVRAFGETVDALRIRDVLVKAEPEKLKPEFNEKSKKWGDVITSIKSGTKTVDESIATIEAAGFMISDQTKQLMKNETI